tara:strand:- start:104 stop:346 length:243 start_codon:yes stop_codon:yes gene_type:complete
MVEGLVSFIGPPKSLLIFLHNFIQIKMVTFVQVIMICGSQYYISLIVENIKNIGVTETLNILEKEVQNLKGADTYPFILY